jgi:hypothetical protein
MEIKRLHYDAYKAVYLKEIIMAKELWINSKKHRSIE